MSINEKIEKAKKYFDEIRNDLVIENCEKQDQCDTEILMAIFALNELASRLDRISYNWSNDFVTRFKENPNKCLSELRDERQVTNLLFDFVMDLSRVGISDMPENTTVKQLTDFIHFWVKENFKRGCDERKSGPEYQLSLEEFARKYRFGN